MHDAPSELQRLSRRLKELRDGRDWTLDELADRTRLSKPYLSRLEAGERQPSIAALLAIAQAYSVPVAALFQEGQESAQVVVRQNASPLQAGNGLFHASLSGRGGDFNLRPIRVVVPADRAGDEQYQHDGEEWLYVLRGTLKLVLGEDLHVLNPGDSAHYDARLPHRLVAGDGQDVELLLVATLASRSLLGTYL